MPRRTTKNITPPAEKVFVDDTPPASGGRAYLLESHTFTAGLQKTRRARLVEIDRIDREIEQYSAEMSRIRAEVGARADHRDQLQHIVSQIDAALAVGPSPIPTQPEPEPPALTQQNEGAK